MPLSDHVSHVITQDTVGLPRKGFGTPMILSCKSIADSFSERIRTFSDEDEVLSIFASTSPEYLAAAAMFRQEPHPEKVKIGRALGQPTQSYQVTVATVLSSHAYQLVVKGEGVTTTTVSITSDSSATDGEICAALVTALNLVAGKNFTASGASSPITILGDAAAEWFSIESVEVDNLTVVQNHAEPGTTLATDLAAIENVDSDWYGLCTLYNSEAYVKAAAAKIEAMDKIYIAASVDTIAINTASDGTQGLLDDLKNLAYARTAGIYHQSPADMVDAAWLGRVSPIDPGKENWAYKTLSGVNPTRLTSTHITNLRARNANYYYTVATKNITFPGTTCNGPTDNGYIDVIRGLDWAKDDMNKSVFEVLAAAEKVPFTKRGIGLIAGAMRASLQRGLPPTRELWSPDPAPKVTTPNLADISPSDKAQRILPDMKYSATLAGSVNKVKINGVVSV